MADQNKTDLVMKFTVKGTNDVTSEGAVDIDPADPMMEGFSPQPYQNYSNYFIVKDFKFNLKVHEDDKDVSAMGQASQQKHAGSPRGMPRITGPFARWRSATNENYAKMHYPVEFNEFEFSRLIDSASPHFFKACCESKTFEKAILVKRVSQGFLGDTSRPSLGYLRLEFSEVLIIGLEWSDGEVVEETCTFICKRLEVSYRQQNMSGDLRSKVEPAKWDQQESRPTGGGGH